MKPVRTGIELLILRGKFDRRTRGVCREPWKHRARLGTFVDVEGVEPTNNAAERALRCAAIWRKLRFGTQSAAGSRFVESALTVWQICRLQGRNACEYLRRSFEAATRGERPESLVPQGV